MPTYFVSLNWSNKSSIQNELLKKCYENKKKIAIDKIDKNLCKKYMLYPAPATFSWNPLGSICITENKYPVNKKSFFGEPNSLRKYLQNNRLEATFSLQEEEGELGNNKESANSVFDWKIDQEIDLLIFQRDKSSKKDEKYYINRLRIEAEDPSRREQQKKDEEGITLAYLNRIQSPRLRKVYERYFGGEQISQFHRHDKLRVYDVRSFNKGYEDDIIHLLEKLALAPETPKLEILFQNQLSLFPGLLVNMDILKYRLMSGVIGSVIHFPNSKISFGRYLKIFILENEFWGGQIQKYFRQLYVNLKQKPHHLLYSLGAYNRFDYLRAELLFMDLLQKYLAVGQNVAVETHAELKGSIIRIRTKLKIPKFGLEGIISEIDKVDILVSRILF